MVYEKEIDKWVITVSMIFIGYKKNNKIRLLIKHNSIYGLPYLSDVLLLEFNPCQKIFSSNCSTPSNLKFFMCTLI